MKKIIVILLALSALACAKTNSENEAATAGGADSYPKNLLRE